MPIKLNSTMEAECRRIAAIYKAKGQNWDAQASATVIVRTILIESGNQEQAESSEPHDKEHRKAMIEAVLFLQTAPINVQRTVLAPLGIMPEVKAQGKQVLDDII